MAALFDETKRPKTAVAVMVRCGDTVLLIKRSGSHGEGSWAFPGGHLEFGETWEECAARELMEEVGIIAKNYRFLTATNDMFEAEGKHYTTIYMQADWAAHEPESKERDRITAIDWCKLTDLPSPLFEPAWTNLRTAQPELFS